MRITITRLAFLRGVALVGQVYCFTMALLVMFTQSSWFAATLVILLALGIVLFGVLGAIVELRERRRR